MPMRTHLIVATALWAAAAARADDAAWPVAGSQGLLRLVIVPTEQARDRDAYLRQIRRLCEPDRSCFLNFYTNGTGAPLSVPLPDAIEREATATFRRSTKQVAESLRWSCRLQIAGESCF
jgi:hypothetical protein